jgi:ATP-dependent Clp protease ATP-binding subunit ClpA
LEHGLEIDLSNSAKEWIANQGYDEDFGARPLKRALQRYVESPLSVKLLEGDYTEGDHVLVDTQDDGLVFSHRGEKSEETPDEPEDEEEVGELAVS